MNSDQHRGPRTSRLRPGHFGRHCGIIACLLGIVMLTRGMCAESPLPSGKNHDWWAFQPMRAAAPPAPEDSGWCRNEIDRFILQQLGEARLKPAPEAGRGVLIRRIYFDMHGLPPTPEEVRTFVHDKSEAAYGNLIDRVLASPRYGERWARFWLDLVRYADSDGYRLDEYRPNAWRYRDYVIDAFNHDKPYDRFVKEQLAGDELFPGDREALIATGYLRHWTYEYNNTDVRRQWSRILDDITDTTGDVFFALGLQCARCHNHKSDPLRREDYYRLQAFFSPIMPRDDLTVVRGDQLALHTKKQRAWEQATAEIRGEMEAVERGHAHDPPTGRLKKLPEDIQGMFTKNSDDRTPLEKQLVSLASRQLPTFVEELDDRLAAAENKRFRELQQRLVKFESMKPPALAGAFAATDAGPVAPPVCIPGKKDAPIEPGIPAVMGATVPDIRPTPGAPQSTGRRAALATWLTRPDNPLTGRIIVNRVWQQHFGRGLVANASDFGHDGGLPSHPELLDWLAMHFVREGWSLKKLHRLILASATYRQSSRDTSAGDDDPDNRLLGHAPIRRLDAEQVRDAILAVSGELRRDAGGPSVNAAVPRRTIYTKAMRNSADPLLEVFDTPSVFSSVCSRNTTTTPNQSLYLLNSQQMFESAKAFAQRLEPEARRADKIARAYWFAFGRAPSADETASAEEFLRQQQPRIDPEKLAAPEAVFRRSRFPFRDGWAAVFSPDTAQRRLKVPHSPAMSVGDFTVEAYQLLRSLSGRREVTPLVSKWDGNQNRAGWEFGIYQPSPDTDAGVLTMRIGGVVSGGGFASQTYYSNLRIDVEKPYYVAAAVKLAGREPPAVTFYVKDLINGDEPLLSNRVPVNIREGIANSAPLGIGGSSGRRGAAFDGMMDEVRLCKGSLPQDELLFFGNESHPKTGGYWRFEPDPGVFRDSSPHRRDIRPPARGPITPAQAALVDFCHVLLMSSEFLYVD
jgi:hypothetical protein